MMIISTPATTLDIVGFSAIRASGFSRAGDSRIYFENTVGADTVREKLQCSKLCILVLLVWRMCILKFHHMFFHLLFV